MRKAIILSFVCFCAALPLTSDDLHPLDVKTGLWENTMTISVSGFPLIPADMQAKLDKMTPEQRARIQTNMKGTPTTRTFKSCLTKERLNSNPFSEKNCTWKELTSTGTKMDGEGTCVTGSEKMKSDVTMHIEAEDSEHVKGTGKLAMSNGGRTMNSSFDIISKYLGADCGDTK